MRNLKPTNCDMDCPNFRVHQVGGAHIELFTHCYRPGDDFIKRNILSHMEYKLYTEIFIFANLNVQLSSVGLFIYLKITVTTSD